MLAEMKWETKEVKKGIKERK